MPSLQTSRGLDAARRVLSTLAWAGIVALIVITVVPADERPTTSLTHSLEHLSAFAIVGTLVGLAFRMRPLSLFMLAVAFSGSLELIQIPLPTRHARFEDFIYDSLGAWIGLAIGYCILALVPRRQRLIWRG